MPHRRYTAESSHSSRSTGSRRSDDSQDSRSTAPTSVHGSPRPSIHHAATDRPIYTKEFDVSPATSLYARSSTETYADAASTEDLCEEPEDFDKDYELPEYREIVETDLRPTSPSDFADYFPSTKRLFIRHDDTTSDGNMNLRVDTEGKFRGAVQLFHLRMQDIKKRKFSLRRYERSSGREVCKAARKYTQPAEESKRPPITRSVSNAFTSFRKPEFKRTDSGHQSRRDIKRSDSGYGSNEDDKFVSKPDSKASLIPTNTTKLEFSNYAQVEVKRRGAKSTKRYEFEYWGYDYAWKRATKKDGEGKEVSYHLYKGEDSKPVAHIVPELRSPAQVREEQRLGGWVPPCSMWISDSSLVESRSDVADVIVATGLIALVDDCIKRHFHSKSASRPKTSRTVSVPLTQGRYDMEFVTPKAMVTAMFKRRDSGASTREREMRGSPLRAVAAY